jgi:hypothetical protein
MGEFLATVRASGNTHGCQRKKGDGDVVLDCGNPRCSDCITREYVRRLQRASCLLEEATIRHWPDTPDEVTDNLLTAIRKGSF